LGASREHQPEAAVAILKFRARPVALEDGKLLAQCHVLGHEGRTANEKGADKAADHNEVLHRRIVGTRRRLAR
jgi:hypothetical protein